MLQVRWSLYIRIVVAVLIVAAVIRSDIGYTHADEKATPVGPTETMAPPTATSTPAPSSTAVPPTVASAATTTPKLEPFCARDDAFSTTSGYTLTVPAPGVFANDRGAFTLVAVGPAGHGNVTLGADGALTYVPTSGYSGTDSFIYELDCGGGIHRYATVTITVTPTVPPRTPTPGCEPLDDAYSTPRNTTLSVPNPGILANDVYGRGISPVVFSVGSARHGYFDFLGGGFIYTPDPAFVGTETITYSMICFKPDGSAIGQSATVTIQVGLPPVTPAPSCAVVNDTYSTSKDTTLTVAKPGVFANDSYPGPFELFAVGSANHGVATIGADGALTYVPNAGFVGTDDVTYSVRCGTGDVFHIERANVHIVVEAPTVSPTIAPTATPTETGTTSI